MRLRMCFFPAAIQATPAPQPKQTSPRRDAAGAASISPGRPVAAIIAWNEDPSDPNVTDHAWPTDGATTETIGPNPRLARIGAVTTIAAMSAKRLVTPDTSR